MKKFLSLLCALTLVVCSVSFVGIASADDVVDITVWDTNNGFLPVEKGSALYNTYVELTGVGVIQPYVEWNGGTTYNEQLNLKIAAGEMPDMFNPNGMETQLITSGALLDLTPYLETYAPNLYNLIGEEVWASVRANDPTGEGKIWYIPQVIYGRNAPMIRKDWLDNLGLEMPTTQSEMVEVLKAFRDQDPNGNGIADELPSGGRAEARWIIHRSHARAVAVLTAGPMCRDMPPLSPVTQKSGNIPTAECSWIHRRPPQSVSASAWYRSCTRSKARPGMP